MKSFTALALALVSASSASAFTINFVNHCTQTVWPAVGQAPGGAVNPNGVKFGAKLAPGQTVSVPVDDHQLGIRAWGRTGCDAAGANCQTGACNGGLVCNDAGITAKVVFSEFGFADFGAAFGGARTSWDLSRVDGSVNLATRLQSSDGQSVVCTQASCGGAQAFDTATDFAADHNSAVGLTYTHTFCPNGGATRRMWKVRRDEADDATEEYDA